MALRLVAAVLGAAIAPIAIALCISPLLRKSLLPTAARRGYTDVVRALIALGADVHADNELALISASHTGRTDVVKTLVSAGAYIHASEGLALYTAAAAGHADVVRVLLAAGAAAHGYGEQALAIACTHGWSAVVRHLIDAGTNIRTYHDQPLRYAACNGHLHIMHLLVEAGADVRPQMENMADTAVLRGHANVLLFLIDTGFRPTLDLLVYAIDMFPRPDVVWCLVHGYLGTRRIRDEAGDTSVLFKWLNTRPVRWNLVHLSSRAEADLPPLARVARCRLRRRLRAWLTQATRSAWHPPNTALLLPMDCTSAVAWLQTAGPCFARQWWDHDRHLIGLTDDWGPFPL